MAVVITFIIVLSIILGAYFLFVVRPEGDEHSRLIKRLGKVRPTDHR